MKKNKNKKGNKQHNANQQPEMQKVENKNIEEPKAEETKVETVEVKAEEVKENVSEEVKVEEVKEEATEEVKVEEVKEEATEEVKEENAEEKAEEVKEETAEEKAEEVKEENVEEEKAEEVKQEATEETKVEEVKEEAAEEAKTEEVKKDKVAKKEKKKKEKNDNKVKLTEKLSLNLRKRWLLNGTRTILIMAIFTFAFISFNLFMSTLKLPEIDVTKSGVYSLSEDSKRALEKVNQDVKIYVYGFEEDSQLIKFLQKYNNVNSRITYEILTEESNYEKVKENELTAGYSVLIFESGDSKKIVDASTEFNTVDYTTYQQIDTTEQSITNAILSLMVDNKPKVYFTEGHGEYNIDSQLTVLNTYLKNESFEIANINLATVEEIPADCSVLAIMSPKSDLYELEREAIFKYIARGGKIYLAIDYLASETQIPNLQAVLGQFGATFENGQIIELAANSSLPAAPNVFKAQLSTISEITSDIHSSNGAVWIAYSGRMNIADEQTLSDLNVERMDLVYSSRESIFLSDLTTDINQALTTTEPATSVVSTMLTKTIPTEAAEGEEAKEVQSVLIASANGNYIADVIVPDLNVNYPLSYLANNKDFALNCMAALADKEGLTIRKELIAQSTFIPTETEEFVVLLIIFGVPALIVFMGIVVWSYRRRRK